MDTGFDSWLGDAEELAHFEYIQYSRGLFPLAISAECLYDLCQSFPRRLREWQESLLEGGPQFFVQNYHDVKFYTDEVDLGEGWILFVLFTEGRLTLLATSAEEEHQARLRSSVARQDWSVGYGEEMTGFRQKPMLEFLRLMYFYLVRHQRTCNARTFRIIFQKGLDCVLDDVQLEAVESSDDADLSNIFLSGCAGSGKSMTGFQWLVAHPMKDAKRVCLTFSESQRRQYEDWQEQENRIRKTIGKEKWPTVYCSRWVDFLLEHAHTYMDRRDYALNAEQSYAVFFEVCDYLPSAYWESIPGEGRAEKGFYLWGEIHGLIKGAMFHRNANSFSEPLTREQYSQLKSFHMEKAEEKQLSGQGMVILFQVYERYEEYLVAHHFLDDNDLARIVMQNLDKILQKKSFKRFDLAFLDDCQDLTEIQLQAIFSLLTSCSQKFMAMDCSQMIHPTWFHAGFAQQLAEQIRQGTDKTFSERYRLPKQYRSMLELMRFQGSILDEIKNIRELSAEDVKPARFAEQDLREGHLPVWIVDTEANREALQSMLQSLQAGDIYVLHARPLRAKERDGKHFTLAECKGIGIASAVLLWNLFTDVAEYVSEAQAWESFYMGAVRPERCLLLLETREGDIGSFLEQLAERGIIEKCESIQKMNDDGSTGVDYLQGLIAEASEESVLDEAYDLYLHEEYEKARTIYRQYPEQREAVLQNMVCKGKQAEQSQDFATALEWYIKLAQESIIGCYCIYELWEQEALLPETRFAADLYFLDHPKDQRHHGVSGLHDLYEGYRQHSGAMGMHELLEMTIGRYPMLRERLDKWADAVWERMDSCALAINDVMDRKADWRQCHE